MTTVGNIYVDDALGELCVWMVAFWGCAMMEEVCGYGECVCFLVGVEKRVDWLIYCSCSSVG